MNSSNNIDDEIFEMLLTKASNEYCKEEGERLLQKAKTLNNHEFSPEFEKKMDLLIKQTSKSSISKNYKKNFSFKKIAAISAIIVGVLIVLPIGGVSVTANKLKILNFLFKSNDDYLKVKLKEDLYKYNFEGLTSSWDYIFLPEYLPAGYVLDNLDCDEVRCEITYKNPDNDIITYKQIKNSTAKYVIGSKQTNVEEIHEEENIKYFYVKGGRNYLIYNMKTDVYEIIGNIDKKELLKISESLKVTGNLNSEVK